MRPGSNVRKVLPVPMNTTRPPARCGRRPIANALAPRWLTAKKPETRAKRVEETVTQAEVNVRANQWRG